MNNEDDKTEIVVPPGMVPSRQSYAERRAARAAAQPTYRVTLNFTEKCNLPVSFNSRTYYAMPFPVDATKFKGMWGLFGDDRTWQERMATNQQWLYLAHVASGGSVLQDNRIVGKIEELGDAWVYGEALRLVVESYEPLTYSKEKTSTVIVGSSSRKKEIQNVLGNW